MVWTRMFALGLGQELPSTLGVITAFFGGLAVGSRWGGRALDRLPSPGIRCAVLEALTAFWALATVLLLLLLHIQLVLHHLGDIPLVNNRPPPRDQRLL